MDSAQILCLNILFLVTKKPHIQYLTLCYQADFKKNCTVIGMLDLAKFVFFHLLLANQNWQEWLHEEHIILFLIFNNSDSTVMFLLMLKYDFI